MQKQSCLIDYIEEPLPLFNSFKDLKREYQEWYSRYELPWAIDESSTEIFNFEENKENFMTQIKKGCEVIANLTGLKALILKPSLRFGYSFSIEIAKKIQQYNILPIITTGMESPIGLLSNYYIYKEIRQIVKKEIKNKITPGLNVLKNYKLDFLKKQSLVWLEKEKAGKEKLLKNNFRGYFTISDLI